MPEKPEPLEIVILDEREIVTYPKIGEEARTIILTYRYADLPPRTLFIPKEEYTPERRAELIRIDVEKAKAFKPTTLRV